MAGFVSDFSGLLFRFRPLHCVRIADGTFLEAAGRGYVVTTTLDVAGARVPFIVKDVILVPVLAARLLSVNRVCENYHLCVRERKQGLRHSQPTFWELAGGQADIHVS